MIPAQELMIGNWIFDCEQYVQVTGIHKDKIYHAYGWVRMDEDCPSAIPITPEWLKRLGFFEGFWETWIEAGDNINISYKEGIIRIKAENATGDGVIQDTEIKYIHQLQNLYFALTGQQLNAIR